MAQSTPSSSTLSDTKGAPRAMSLGHLVYEGVRGRILRHELRMGDPLREDEVASWFDASRLPAREALKRLEQEGLVERVGRKYMVRRYTDAEILVTYTLRAALEHLAVAIAVPLLSDEDATLIEQILRDQRAAAAAQDRGAFSLLDYDFHISFARISANRALVRELCLVMNRVTLIRGHELAIDSGPLAALEDHLRIFDAIRRHDIGSACAELDYHYATTLRLHGVPVPPQVAPLPLGRTHHIRTMIDEL